MSLRFQLDEHVPDAIAFGLRRRGVDVLIAQEAGVRSTPDEVIMRLARDDRRVIVTHDQDYLRIYARGDSHAGIAFATFGSRTIGQLIVALVDLDERFSAEDMRDQLVYL